MYTVTYSGRPAGELDDRYVAVVSNGKTLWYAGDTVGAEDGYLYGGSKDFDKLNDAIAFAKYRAGVDD